MARRLLAVVNPLGGSRHGRRILARARPRLEAAGFRVEAHVTRAPGHAVELAATLVVAPGDILCAVGGDGTLHEVVNGWLAREDRDGQSLALLPAGSGNSVARSLGMAEPATAVERLVRGGVRRLDLLRLHLDGRKFWALNVVGWGAIARISRRAERLRLLRGRRYHAAAVAELFRPGLGPVPFQVRGLPGDLPAGGAWLLGAACVTRHAGRGMELAPHVRPGSGEVAVLLMRSASRPALLGLLLQVLRGAHLASPLVAACHAHQLEVALPEGQDLLVVDGEIHRGRLLSLEVHPGGLPLLA